MGIKQVELYDFGYPLRSMKPRKPHPTQQPMEHMAHLMKECHHVIVTHQCRLIGCRLCKIGDHRGNRVVAALGGGGSGVGLVARISTGGRWLGIGGSKFVASDKRPDGGMAIFVLCRRDVLHVE